MLKKWGRWEKSGRGVGKIGDPFFIMSVMQKTSIEVFNFCLILSLMNALIVEA